MGKLTINGSFSIAMLVYQRVVRRALQFFGGCELEERGVDMCHRLAGERWCKSRVKSPQTQKVYAKKSYPSQMHQLGS